MTPNSVAHKQDTFTLSGDYWPIPCMRKCDLNNGKDLFEGMAGIKTDPEMVQLATQLVQRQAGKYDAADLEDRYGVRLKALIDAKLKGKGLRMPRSHRLTSWL